MRLVTFPLLLALMVLSLAGAAPTKPAAEAAGGRVDSTAIHKLYMDGEFETAISMLELNLKNPSALNHNDSVFIFKHLGVMYAATYETREKGKYYMHQLLMTEPTAKIMDMYASDMIYMIFKNIQDEFISKRARINPDDYADPEPGAKPKSRTKTYVWIGAAVVTVGVGVVILLMTMSGGGGTTHDL